MEWEAEAMRLFTEKKPLHFTDHTHCEECAEHDATLRNADRESIGLDELGNPGWDPICFCTVQGKKYYMPAFVRLTLETINNEFYLDQFLFHLEGDGANNALLLSCNEAQRDFIARFIAYLIENHATEIDSYLCSDRALRVYQLWSCDQVSHD